MTKQIEKYAVNFGPYATHYVDAAETVGISQAGVFILSACDDLIKRGEIDEPVVSAREQLLAIANDIEANGVREDRRHELAEILRYLSQFSLERAVPSFDRI